MRTHWRKKKEKKGEVGGVGEKPTQTVKYKPQNHFQK